MVLRSEKISTYAVEAGVHPCRDSLIQLLAFEQTSFVVAPIIVPLSGHNKTRIRDTVRRYQLYLQGAHALLFVFKCRSHENGNSWERLLSVECSNEQEGTTTKQQPQYPRMRQRSMSPHYCHIYGVGLRGWWRWECRCCSFVEKIGNAPWLFGLRLLRLGPADGGLE